MKILLGMIVIAIFAIFLSGCGTDMEKYEKEKHRRSYYNQNPDNY